MVLTVFCIDIHGQNKGIQNALKTKLSEEDCHAERLLRPAAIFVYSLHRFDLFLCYRAGQMVLASSCFSFPTKSVYFPQKMWMDGRMDVDGCGSSYLSQEGREALWRTATRYCCACSPWALQCPCPKRRARGAGGSGGNGAETRGRRLQKVAVDEGHGVTAPVWGNGKAPARW